MPRTNPNSVEKFCPRCRASYPQYAQFCPQCAVRLVGTLETNVPGGVTGAAFTNAPAVSQAYSAQPQQHSQFNQQPQHFQQPAPAPTEQRSGADEVLGSDANYVGKVIAGKYRIDSFLGEGGMARVFRATHMQIEKPVVIKLMFDQGSAMKNAAKRFEQEIKLTARLNHPNLVNVFDGGLLDGQRPFLVMEYIEGHSLRERLTRQGVMSFRDAATVIIQACSGLQEAHQQGIIHRDLKPENIMLREKADRPDWVKVLDFGIAHLKAGGQKLTATGIALGTVDYMSPEYLSDKPIDQRADIYALGVIFYELLTGICPLQGDTIEATMAKHLFASPQPPSLARKELKPGCAFDKIVEKSLEKDPKDRYQTALDMKADLEKSIVDMDALKR
jgi:serine/threonine-protein kinase